MNELISVIINVYNGEKYIKKCIDSIINQTYKNIDILIINDGSTDNTLKKINEYKDKRIRVITTENLGLSLSRNIGIDNAKGKYLYFIDVDDFIELDTIEYLYGLIKKYKSQIAICESLNIYNNNFIKDNKKEEVYELDSKELIRKILFCIGNNGTFWNKLYDKKLFKNIRFEDRIVNDVTVVYKLYLESKKNIYSNQIKYYYFRHDDSIIGKRKRNRQIDMYKASLERYYCIKKIYPDFIENDIGLLLMIFNLYYKDYNKISDFYREENIKKMYNSIFSFKILKSDLRFNDKVKLVLFRFFPRFSKIITDMYISLNKR